VAKIPEKFFASPGGAPFFQKRSSCSLPNYHSAFAHIQCRRGIFSMPWLGPRRLYAADRRGGAGDAGDQGFWSERVSKAVAFLKKSSAKNF
jgi:hypothetical protein